MATNKLYGIRGRNPKYNFYFDEYDRLRVNSKILNNASNVIGIHMKLFNRENIEKEIVSLTGDEQGQYYIEKQLYMASIPYVKKELLRIEERFQDFKKYMTKQGKPAPTEMPKELFEEKCKLDARLSVHLEELDLLQKRLNEYAEKDQDKSNNKVLEHGPQGNSRLLGGYIVEVDGMHVSLSDDGIPYINDPRAGKLDGFSTGDYFQFIVKPWLSACEKQAQVNLAEAKKAGISKDKISRGKREGTNVPWPVMPADCINYKVTSDK